MSNITSKRSPLHGVGVGLRSCHYHYILNNRPNIPWFEILSDNYLIDGGPQLAYLDTICANYPIIMHGVGMSIGSTDPLNLDYLKKLKQLATRIDPVYVSDHLCWISVDGHYFHDLLPLPFTDETITYVANRIQQIQDFLGRQILIENISSYLEYNMDKLPEWEFINHVAEEADCGLLLDINNIYVSAQNHSFNPSMYIQKINPTRVKQYHLAGYTDKNKYLFDTHSEPVHEPVWSLYQDALCQVGKKPSLIEWDGDIPQFTVLAREASKAQKIMDNS